MILTFLISKHKIAELEVDINKKKVTVLYKEDEVTTGAVLAKNDMTYEGLERRLQYLMDDKRQLPELIESIRQYDINTPIQYQLHIKVKDCH